MPKKTIFTPAEIAQAIANIPEMSTPVMDTFFPAKNRRNHQWPYLNAAEVSRLIKNVPVVSRDSQSYGQAGTKVDISQIVPMPVKLSRTISDARLNDLRSMSVQGRIDFLSGEIASMRESIRLTAEALAAQAITAGAIDYNMMVDGVLESYKVNYGKTPATFTVGKKWDASDAGLAVILSDLSKMASVIRKAGGSGAIAFGVDSTTFAVVAEKILKLTNDNRIAAVVGDGSVKIGAYTITEIADTYTKIAANNTTSEEAKIPAKTIIASAVDANHFRYASIDDADAGFAGMPLFVKQIPLEDPSGCKLLVQSKPFPLPNLTTTVKAVVLT